MWKMANAAFATLLLYLIPVGAMCANGESPWQSFRTTLQQATVGENDIAIIVSQAGRRQVTPADAVPWAALLLKMQQAGLPVAPGTDRIEQGLAKNIPAHAITRSLETLYKDLEWGKSLVDAKAAGGSPEPAARVAAIVENLEVAKRQDFDMMKVSELMTKTDPGIERVGLMTEVMTSWNAYGLGAGFVLDSLGGMRDSGVLSYDNLVYLNGMVEDYVVQGRGTDEIAAAVSAEIHQMKDSLDIRNIPGSTIRQDLGKQAPMSEMDGGLGIGSNFISPVGGGSGSGGGGGVTLTGGGTGGCMSGSMGSHH